MMCIGFSAVGVTSVICCSWVGLGLLVLGQSWVILRSGWFSSCLDHEGDSQSWSDAVQHPDEVLDSHGYVDTVFNEYCLLCLNRQVSHRYTYCVLGCNPGPTH